MNILPPKKVRPPKLKDMIQGRVFCFEDNNNYMVVSEGEVDVDTEYGCVLVVRLASGTLSAIDVEALVTPLPHAVLCPEGLPEGGQS